MSRFAARDGELDLLGARITVLGLGRSGAAAARAGLQGGASVTVLEAGNDEVFAARARELAPAHVVLGAGPDAVPTTAELVVPSPGIAPSHPWLKRAAALGIPVWSEIELAYRLGRRPAVAITGTNGKTTATEMTVAALRAAGQDAVAAGNIGAPLMDARAEVIVAELSSFQLHHIAGFRAPVAVLLNIGHDHLDWHGGFEPYARAKGRIFENQSDEDVAIYFDDAECARQVAWSRGTHVPFAIDRVPAAGAGVVDGWIFAPQGRVTEVASLQAHHRPFVIDAVAAAAAACALGADPLAVGRGLASYAPAPHRIEFVATIDGVTYINDSKASDPHAVRAALDEMTNVILIAGGRNKGLDLGELRASSDRVRAVFAIGEAADEIVAAFAPTDIPVARASDVHDAVRRAASIARPGDTVLLGPACASWDMFRSYEERGEAFRNAVSELRRTA